MKYRPDIDGLRAIAVVSVVLYHAGFASFPGGFAGVDIFFVISGYLISSLVIEDLGGNRFSVIAFYERRVRRILPALFVVLLFATVAAYSLLLPPDMSRFGGSLLAVLSFCSNIYFYQSTDYFAPAAEMTPLLHMWSLSVEEQFYIVYPLFLAVVTRYFPNRYAYILGALLLFSLAWNIRNLNNPLVTFYSTPARAWELLLGGLLAMKSLKGMRCGTFSNVLGIGGLSLIGYSLLVPLPQSMSYVVVTFSACLGTALVIQSGVMKDGIVSRVMSVPPMVFIGLISYSLYLWHWVLLVFARFYFLHPLTIDESILIVAASGLMSVLSWRFVETPFRRVRFRNARNWIFGTALTCACMFMAFGALIYTTQGLPGRFRGALEIIAAGAKDSWARWVECQYKICRVGPAKTAESFILWGDSHGGSIAPAIERIAEIHDVSGYVAFNPSCPPVIGLDNFDMAGHPCPLMADSVMSFIKSHHIKTVLLHASWAAYVRVPSTDHAKPVPGASVDYKTRLKAFDRQMDFTMQTLNDLGVHIIIIASVPEAKVDVPTALARAFTATGSPDITTMSYSKADFLRREAAVVEVLRRLVEKYSAAIVYPHEMLCNNVVCLAAGGLVPFYSDSQHLTVHGAMFLMPMFERLLTPVASSVVPHTPLP